MLQTLLTTTRKVTQRCQHRWCCGLKIYPAIIPNSGFKYIKIYVQCYIMGSGFGQVRCIYGSSDCGVALDRQSGDEPVAPKLAEE